MQLQPVISRLPSFLRRHLFLRWLSSVLPRTRKQLIHFNGNATAFIDISDSSARQYLLAGEFEPEFFEIASQLIQADGVFFDVGANFGLCSFGLIGLHSSLRLKYHLFEANSSLCDLLQASWSCHPEAVVKITRGTVTDKRGTSRFEINSDSLGESKTVRTGGFVSPNVVLDDYISEHQISSIDLAKFDIEGWEPAGFKGCHNSFRQGIFKAIYFEVASSILIQHGFLPTDPIGILKDHGFNIFFCKREDRHNAKVTNEKTWELFQVGGKRLWLSPMGSFPKGHQTDLLAIHESVFMYSDKRSF